MPFLLLLTLIAYAHESNTEIDLAPRRFQINPQHGKMWCWAACIQNVLDQFGKGVKQKDVVITYKGKVVDNGIGNAKQIAGILRTYDVPTRYVNRPPSKRSLIRTLREGKKVIGIFKLPWLPKGDGHVMNIQDVDDEGKYFLLSDPDKGETIKVTYAKLKSLGFHSAAITINPATYTFITGRSFPHKPST